MDPDDDHVDPHVGDGLDPGPDRPRSSVTDSPTGARVIRVGATLDATAGLRFAARSTPCWPAPSTRWWSTSRPSATPSPPAPALCSARRPTRQAPLMWTFASSVTLEHAGMARAVLDDEALFEVYPTLDAALQRPPDAPPPRPGADHPGPPSPGGR